MEPGATRLQKTAMSQLLAPSNAIDGMIRASRFDNSLHSRPQRQNSVVSRVHTACCKHGSNCASASCLTLFHHSSASFSTETQFIHRVETAPECLWMVNASMTLVLRTPLERATMSGCMLQLLRNWQNQIWYKIRPGIEIPKRILIAYLFINPFGCKSFRQSSSRSKLHRNTENC